MIKSEFRSVLGENIEDVIRYDDVTGYLYWKKQISNRIKIGDVAGSVRHDGYVTVSIFGKEYLAHRIAYYLMTCQFPEDELDHIDGNPNNNKWDNIRDSTRSGNNQNTRGYGKLGVRNVYYRPDRNTYQVKLMVDGKRITIGSYSDLELAELVAAEARELHHKQFAYKEQCFA